MILLIFFFSVLGQAVYTRSFTPIQVQCWRLVKLRLLQDTTIPMLSGHTTFELPWLCRTQDHLNPSTSLWIPHTQLLILLALSVEKTPLYCRSAKCQFHNCSVRCVLDWSALEGAYRHLESVYMGDAVDVVMIIVWKQRQRVSDVWSVPYIRKGLHSNIIFLYPPLPYHLNPSPSPSVPILLPLNRLQLRCQQQLLLLLMFLFYHNHLQLIPLLLLNHLLWEVATMVRSANYLPIMLVCTRLQLHLQHNLNLNKVP
jgi:hypothetical protein